MSSGFDHIRRAAALTAIADERRRQIEVEGWTEASDDAKRADGSLAMAASAYALLGIGNVRGYEGEWPVAWGPPRKVQDPRRALVIAGALIVAEIERLDRAAVAVEPCSHPECGCDDDAVCAERVAALEAKAPTIPEPPWTATPVNANNAKREGWRSFFVGRARDAVPFPQDRADLRKGYHEGWDRASQMVQP